MINSQPLSLAQAMKLVKLGQISLDGTKIKANASKLLAVPKMRGYLAAFVGGQEAPLYGAVSGRFPMIRAAKRPCQIG